MLSWREVDKFASEESGTIAVVFAVLFLVICGSAGLAIDYSRAERTKSRIELATDAANLTAAKTAAEMASKDPTLSEAEVAAQARAIGEKMFQANLGPTLDFSLQSYELDVRIDQGAWVATSSYVANAHAMLMSALDISDLELNGTSEARVRPGFPVLDIAMCVDSTGSMTDTLDAVKSNATTFYDRLKAELDARGIPPFAQVRVRLAYFKDYGDVVPGVWDLDPMRTSDFFTLPAQNSDFLDFANPQVAGGGADWAEGAAVCVNNAMDSTWMKVGDVLPGTTNQVTNVFPLIVVWTDAPAHGVDFVNSLANPDYPPPSEMPRNYSDFLAKWNDPAVIDQANKQILFFGDPSLDDSYAVDRSAWLTIRDWPGFTVGGTLLEGNTSMVEFLAQGIALKAQKLAITN
jgi:Flp pilus assembly protein TadG